MPCKQRGGSGGTHTRVYMYRRYIWPLYRTYRRDEEANKIEQREALVPKGE